MTRNHQWVNHTEEILKKELGEEYTVRLDKQNELFKKASEIGNIFRRFLGGTKTAALETIFDVRTIPSGQRATHPVGIGAQGFAKVATDLKIPENAFFTPGRLFEVRIRHSNFPDAADDRKPNVHSLAIKFADHDWESPLDLICHTGPLSPFFNADSVTDLMFGLLRGTESTKKYLLSLPVYLDAHIQGIRRNSDSYYHQHFYAQTVYDFKCKDEKKRLARFRILPSDGSSESGRLTAEEQEEAWDMDTVTDSNKKQSYLKEEFSERLKMGLIHYTLQIQFMETSNHAMYNASATWSDSDHPWTDLMNVTLTSQLPVDVTEVTRFNIGNHPKEVLAFPPARTTYDFNIVPQMRAQIYSAASSLRPKEPRQIEGKPAEYTITVVTGDKLLAGTNADVSISLIGTKSRTSFRKLDRFLHDDFEQGSSCAFQIRDKDVGDVLCIKVHCGGKEDWYLRSVDLECGDGSTGKKGQTFPIYRWMTDKITLITACQGKASLPQSDIHPYLKLVRELEIQERQRLYQWSDSNQRQKEKLEKYPGYIAAGSDTNSLPRDVQFDGLKRMQLAYRTIISGGNYALGIVRQGIQKVTNIIFKPPDVIAAKQNLLSSVIQRSQTMEHVIKSWEKNVEFGRQMIQGINPVKIVRVQKIPENFPVTEDLVKTILGDGKTLDNEIKAGKVYLLSYPELESYAGTRHGQKRFLCAPMCLLYVKQGKLVPIAIQLAQNPSQGPIFTQDDDKVKDGTSNFSDWLIAKMWVRVADANVHQMASHLMGTHLLMEPVAVALHRNLPSMHPIFKLMIPHIRYVMAINTLGREALIPDDQAIAKTLAIAEVPGAHVKFMAEVYENLTIASLDIPKGFKERGVEDEDLLPGYLYRDNSLLLWEAIGKFVSTLVNIYYKTDGDIEADPELTSMMHDLQTNGYHENFGIPSNFEAKAQLVHFLTAIIFCCSCQHAAVNFGQLDHYGFIPNAPPCLMQNPPTHKNPDGLDDEGMKNLLPTDEICHTFIGTTSLLSVFSVKEVYLGNYPDEFFTEAEPRAAIKEFQNDLKEISTRMKQHNGNVTTVPYEYLLPEKVPNSIAI